MLFLPQIVPKKKTGWELFPIGVVIIFPTERT